MLYVLGILALLIVINIFLLCFSCNGCEKISNKKDKVYVYPDQNKKQALEDQMAFDK